MMDRLFYQVNVNPEGYAPRFRTSSTKLHDVGEEQTLLEKVKLIRPRSAQRGDILRRVCGARVLC